MTFKLRHALRDLLRAVERIKVPLQLEQTQVQAYNELMFAAANAEVLLEESSDPEMY